MPSTDPTPAQADVPTTPAGTDASNIDSVYDNLVQGVGHEHVNDANVEELIRRADADNHPVLAAELREWRSATGPDANIDLDPAHRNDQASLGASSKPG